MRRDGGWWLPSRARRGLTTTCLLLGLAGALVAALVAGAAPGGAQAEVPTTASTVIGAAPSPAFGATDGPQPVGQPEPPRSQRIGDSLIWLWVMAVLVVGAIAGVFGGRRRRPEPPVVDAN